MKNSVLNIIICFNFLLIGKVSSGQHSSLVRFGSLDTIRISVEEFNLQHSLEAKAGYSIDSATAFFYGAGFPHVYPINILPEFDSLKFIQAKSLLVPGSAVSFEILLRQKNTGNLSKVFFGYMFYGMKKVIPARPPESYNEFKRLSGLNYQSGTIYLKKANTNDVIVYLLNFQTKNEIKQFFGLMAHGMTITFDKVLYKTEQGEIKALNQTFKY